MIEIGIKGLIVKDGKFLAMHKQKVIHDKYELPGGRVQFGETIENALKREILEETGFEVMPRKIVDSWNYVDEPNQHQIVGVIYYCEIIGEKAEVVLSGEHDKYKWLSPNEYDELNVLFYNEMKNFDWTSVGLNQTSNQIIGMNIKVKIDRPLGSAHPKYPDMIYPVNYGYIEGIIGGDGDEQDVYLLGVNKPVDEYTGRVIGIIHRFNDNEDKWIVAPENMSFSKKEILEIISFQEKYYESILIMD